MHSLFPYCFPSFVNISFILVPPRIIEKPQSRNYSEGSRIIFTCLAKGPPTPTVSWRIFNDQVEINKTDYNNGTLVIYILKSLGKYNVTVICHANSAGGDTFATAMGEILGTFNMNHVIAYSKV